MKVGRAAWTGPVQGGPAPRAASAGFAPDRAVGAEALTRTAPASSLGAVSSLDALLALQEAPGPMERRKRAVRRAGRILDVLDDLKLATLADDGDDVGGGAAVLVRLQAAVRDARAETEDPALEDVLEQIEVRAAVELAKRESVDLGRTGATL